MNKALLLKKLWLGRLGEIDVFDRFGAVEYDHVPVYRVLSSGSVQRWPCFGGAAFLCTSRPRHHCARAPLSRPVLVTTSDALLSATLFPLHFDNGVLHLIVF